MQIDRETHTINGCITVIPYRDDWITFRSPHEATRMEFLDLDPDTTSDILGWFHASSRIAGAHTSRIRDTGVVFDIDGSIPDRPLLYIESDHLHGLSLYDLTAMGSSAQLISRLLFRTAFSLNCLGMAFCRHEGLTAENLFLTPHGLALPHPRSSPRTKPVEPVQEFIDFTTEVGLKGNSTDAAFRFLEEGVIPDSEVDWVRLYHAEPTSWLLGMEGWLDHLLMSVEFANRNGFKGVNVIGKTEWGLGILEHDFCVLRRLLGNHVVQITADSPESLNSRLSARFKSDGRENNSMIEHITQIPRLDQVDLVVNSLHRGSIQEKQMMVTRLLELADNNDFQMLVLSDTDLCCDKLFRMTIPFQKAGKRGLLSRITSRQMDRTPSFFGDWLSSLEYYQLITKCNGNSTSIRFTDLLSVPGQASVKAAHVLQGVAFSEFDNRHMTESSTPYAALVTGYGKDLSVWIPGQSCNSGQLETSELREHMIESGCSNLRELNWILDDQVVPSLEKSLLLRRFLSTNKDLITTEDKLIMLGKIVFICLDLDTAMNLLDLLVELADFKSISIRDLQPEMRECCVKIADAVGKLELSIETLIILDILRVKANEHWRVYGSIISICRKCIELHNPDLASLCAYGLLAAPSDEDDPSEAQLLLTKLLSIAQTDEQRRMFEMVRAYIPILHQRNTELVQDILAKLEVPDPVDNPGIFIFRLFNDTVFKLNSDAISGQKARQLLSDAKFIASINGYKMSAYRAIVTEITICRSIGNLNAWEIEESLNYAMVQFRNWEEERQPISEFGLLVDSNLQQMNLNKADSILRRLLDYWGNEMDAIKPVYSGSQDEGLREVVFTIISLCLAIGDLDSLQLKLTEAGLENLLPSDCHVVNIDQALSQLNWYYPPNLSFIRTQAVILQESRTKSDPTEFKEKLCKLGEFDPPDFVSDLRRGDLLFAYIGLTRLAASDQEELRIAIRGHTKVLRALERRYKESGLPMVDGATPLEILLGSGWIDSQTVLPRVIRGRIPVPDDLEALRKLLVCDAVWLFKLGMISSPLIDHTAPESFPSDVSWLKRAIEKLRFVKPYEVIDVLGSGWAAGHSIPATTSVLLEFENESVSEFRILVAESICPGKALTNRQKVLLADYARAISKP